MIPADETDPIRRAIHNNGKEVQNISAEHAHLDGIVMTEAGELSAEKNLLTIGLGESNLGLDHDRFGCAADPTQLIRAFDWSQLQET
jgi:hypothetical protein